MRIDIHQHVWTAPLQAALARRERLPLICRRDSGHTVHCVGEQPWVLDAGGENVAQRTGLLDTDGLDAAIVAISSPIGIEALPRDEALELIDVHLDGVDALGPRFGAWGPLVTGAPEPGDVDRLAARGCVGISIAAGAIGTPERLNALGSVLGRVAALDLPLFVHPGRGSGDPVCHPGLEEPLWWRALNDYVHQMQAAWLAWADAGRFEHPRLRVIFAMLAGLAPLQGERLATRGGPPVDLGDPLTFYDTSSYGPAAIDAAAEVVGRSQLLYGSDRPVLEPIRTDGDRAFQRAAGELFNTPFERRGVRTAVAV